LDCVKSLLYYDKKIGNDILLKALKLLASGEAQKVSLGLGCA